MRRFNWWNERARYTAVGAFFGVLFPVIAYLTITFVSRDIYILFGVICTAPFFLGAVARLAGLRQDRLDEINRGLERLVEERTSSIQSMLDLSGQGFLSFGSDLLVKPEYSKECVRIFGGPIRGRRVDDLLYADQDAANEFVRGLSLCFSGSAKPEVIFDLLDHELQIDGKTIHAEYRLVTNERVMITLTDVTEELLLQELVRSEDERNGRLLRAVRHKTDFGAFAGDAARLFAAADRPGVDVDSFARDVHTFKGNAGFFAFRATQEAAHELESYITDCRALGEDVSLDGRLERLRGAFAEDMQIVTGTLGAVWLRDVDAVVVPRRDYLRIEGHVLRHYSADLPLIHSLERNRKRPLSELFVRFPQMAADLAHQRGKRILPPEITGGHTRVLPERYERLVSSFGHLVRNTIDHGIEPPAERQAAGKPPEGALRIDIRDGAEEIVIRFSDDGRGIDLDKVEERARQLGLIDSEEHPSASRLLACIFHDNFSTAATVSVVSGRGVGLAAVREAVREAGGRITISTRAGEGTAFTITLPLRPSRSQRT